MHLTARLFPDPLVDIQRSAIPPSLNWGGVLLLRGREGAGRGRKGTEKRRGGERDREVRVMGGDCLLFI